MVSPLFTLVLHHTDVTVDVQNDRRGHAAAILCMHTCRKKQL